jgi:integrase
MLRKFEIYSSLATRRREKMAGETKRYILFYLNEFLRDHEPGYFELMDYLAHKKAGPNTKATIVRGLGKFFYWARVITRDEFDLLKQSFRPIQKPFSTKSLGISVDAIIDFCATSGHSLLRARNMLIFGLLGTVGMRVSQLSELNREDISITDVLTIHLNRKKGYIGVDTKVFKKDAAIGKYKLTDLLKWWDDYRLDVHPLIHSRQGNRLPPKSLQKLVDRTSGKIGVKITSHSFRHHVCTKIADSHGILRAQTLLGHRDIRTTLKYVNTDFLEAL